MQRPSIDYARKAFRKLKIATLERLMVLLLCSRRTVQRRLREWGCLSSYNHNGKYYTLPDIPRFNEYGIWTHRNVCFSRHGTLAITVETLVRESDAGLTARELEGILMLKPYSFMSRFVDQLHIQRHKFDGRYVFVTDDAKLRRRQLLQRREQASAEPALPATEVIEVLVELLKHPTYNCKQLARRVSDRAPHATPRAIGTLLRQHDLLPQKKGSGSKPSGS